MKKCFVIILTVIMVLGSFVPVFADENDKGAIEDGKLKIAFFGTSLVQGGDGDRVNTGRIFVDTPVPERIAENLYVECDNYGVSEQGLLRKADNGKGPNGYDTLISTDISDYDIIMTWYGGNDRTKALGTAESTGWDTVSGMMKNYIEYIQTNYPDKYIIFVEPMPRNQDMVNRGTLYAEICSQYDVQYMTLDRYGITSENAMSMCPDGKHLTQDAYDIVANGLSADLASIYSIPYRIPIDDVQLKYSFMSCRGTPRTQTSGIFVTAQTDLGTRILNKGTDYSVRYTNNTDVGKASVEVTGKGLYRGSIKKSFRIVPARTRITSIKSLKAGKITVEWRIQDFQTDGYEIKYSTNKEFTHSKTIIVKSPKKTYKIIKGLKSGQKYYIRIRPYKEIAGKTYKASWSGIRSVKTK